MTENERFADIVVQATSGAVASDGWQSELEHLKAAVARRPVTEATILITGIGCRCEQCREPVYPGHNPIIDYAVVSGLEEAKRHGERGWLLADRAMRNVPEYLAEEVAAEDLREYRAVILAEKDVNLFCRKIEALVEDCCQEGVPGLFASQRLKLRARNPASPEHIDRVRSRRRKRFRQSANMFRDFGIEVLVVDGVKRGDDAGEHGTFVRRLGWVPLKV